MRKIKRHLLIIPFLLLVSGCLISQEPFYQESDLIIDDRIVGTYRISDDSTPFYIIKDKDPYHNGQYFVVLTSTPNRQVKLDATLFQIGTNRFLDILPELESLGQDSRPQSSLIGVVQMFMLQPLHLLVKMDIQTNDVRFGVADVGELDHLRKKYPQFFQVKAEPIRMIPNIQLQREFLLRFGGDTNLFKMTGSQNDWKQPINFYGKVVSESNEPVASANACLTWMDLSESGTSEVDVKSDANGFFSLIHRAGKHLSVAVSKDGYYIPKGEELKSFAYANSPDGLFTPDAGNPVVFHLRKKGVGVDLITSHYGMKDYFGIPAALDGTPVQVDLLERKTGQGQMTISQIKPELKNWKQATNWVFKMEIPDGGFIGENDEFPFEAPAEGYQPTIEFDFQQDQPDWTTDIRTNYYIKFGNPPHYGWLKLDTSIMMEGARLTYAINPDGSRNLEPK